MYSYLLLSIVVALLAAPQQLNARAIPSSVSSSNKLINQQQEVSPTESSGPVEELNELTKSSASSSSSSSALSSPTDQVQSQLLARLDKLPPQQYVQLIKSVGSVDQLAEIIQQNEARIQQQIDQMLELANRRQFRKWLRNKRGVGESRYVEWLKKVQRLHEQDKTGEQDFTVNVANRGKRSFGDDDELLSDLEDQQLDRLVRALLQRQVLAKQRAELESDRKAKNAQPKRSDQAEEASARLLSILLANIAAEDNSIEDPQEEFSLDKWHKVLEHL